MSALLDTTSIKASGSRSVVSFEQPAHEDYAGWSRYLTLDGEKAYFIGGACDTCAFVFERTGGASRNISPGEAADGLRRGLSKIEDAPISTISEFVPGGSYRVNLLQLSPTLVTTRHGTRLLPLTSRPPCGAPTLSGVCLTTRRPNTTAPPPSRSGEADASSSSWSPCSRRAG